MALPTFSFNLSQRVGCMLGGPIGKERSILNVQLCNGLFRGPLATQLHQ